MAPISLNERWPMHLITSALTESDTTPFATPFGRFFQHERTRNEKAQQRNAALFAKIQRVSSTGSFCWRVDSNEMSWSEEIYRIFAFERTETVTLEKMAARVHLEDLWLFQRMLDEARTGAELDFEYRLYLPDSSVRYVRMVASGTEERDSQLEYVGAIQDITQCRVSEAALDKMRSELARLARIASLGSLTASIAHEVSQPLTGIITNASACLRILAADRPNVDSARETLRRAMRDSQRACDVITRLRALFSKKRATTEPLSLNEAVEEVIALLKNELRRRGIALRLELAANLPPVLADRVQLQQVILNLLLNAAEAMSGIEDRTRELVLRTECDEEQRVRLSVVDVGIGFEQHEVEKLFDAFYTTKSTGMGIGLSVSRSIIESHHGQLWAQPNDGPGATFTFSIPGAPDPERS
jgi:signal transduction histidine kinase